MAARKGYTAGHHNAPKYSEDLYINVARSIFLEVERKVIETPPTRPAQFWRQVDEAINRARSRVRMIQSGHATEYDPKGRGSA